MLVELPEPLLEIFVASLAFSVFLVVHIIWWCRVSAERAGFVLMCGLWLLALLAVMGVAVSQWSLHVLTVVAVDGLLMALYMHLYTGMLRSVSLRLLGELEARDGVADRATLEAVYSPESMLDSRLQWMVERGLVSSDSKGFDLTTSGQRLLAARRPLASWLVEGPTG